MIDKSKDSGIVIESSDNEEELKEFQTAEEDIESRQLP